MNTDVVEGQESNTLPSTIQLTTRSEPKHCHNRGATFPVVSFVLYPSLQIIGLINSLVRSN